MSEIAHPPQNPVPSFNVGSGITAREPALVIGTLTAVVDAGLVLLFAFVTSFRLNNRQPSSRSRPPRSRCLLPS